MSAGLRSCALLVFGAGKTWRPNSGVHADVLLIIGLSDPMLVMKRRNPIPLKERTSMTSNKLVANILELVAAATDADVVEFFLQTLEPTTSRGTRIVVGAGAIMTDDQLVHEPCIRDELRLHDDEPWTSAVAATPLCGPSAEAGWIAAGHHQRNFFTATTLETLEIAARAVEQVLDAAFEHSQLYDVSIDLRDSQNDSQGTRRAREQAAVPLPRSKPWANVSDT